MLGPLSGNSQPINSRQILKRIAQTASMQPEDNTFGNRKRTESFKLAASNSAAASSQSRFIKGQSQQKQPPLIIATKSHLLKGSNFHRWQAHLGNLQEPMEVVGQCLSPRACVSNRGAKVFCSQTALLMYMLSML